MLFRGRDGGPLWHLQNAENGLEQIETQLREGWSNMTGISSAVWSNDVDESRRLIITAHTRTDTHTASTLTPPVHTSATLARSNSHLQVCTWAQTLSHIYNYAACMLQWDHLCSNSNPPFSMPLLSPVSPPPPAIFLCSLSPFVPSLLSSTFPPFLFLFRLSFPLFCSSPISPPPFPPLFLSLLSSVSVSRSPLLPLEAGDVEGCSAVSDYQAWLCERNDNHCAALQREKEEREWEREREKREG